MKKIITSIGLCMLIAGMAISAAAKGPKADGPTAKNLMAAEEALAKAFRENTRTESRAICRMTGQSSLLSDKYRRERNCSQVG
jgi:hypothetical protein